MQSEIKVFITGGTFDKEYNELNGTLYFNETHLFEVSDFKETEGQGIEGWINERHVKIGELNFDIITPVDEESLPTLEIENDSSAVFIKHDYNDLT